MNRIRLVTILCLLLLSTFAKADSGTWNIVKQGLRNTTDQPQSGNFYRVDQIKLRQQLSRATHEGRSAGISEIELPVSNGKIERFSIEESPIMAAGLAARYPDIKTYKIQGLDNPHASGRLSIDPKGFHGMITDPRGTFYIDPQSDDTYRAYGRKSQHQTKTFNCGVKGHTHSSPVGITAARTASRTAGSLRVYRLAVAATTEYVAAVGGTDRIASAQIITAINRVNQIYQRDLGIKLELVGNNDNLLETSGNLPVDYSNSDASAMLEENQDNIDAVIGSSNYDIGHVFSTAGSSGGSGIAYVSSVCSNTAKAGGVTGLANPVGDAFYIDFVAHEMGHQFSAEHTFNGTSSACSGINRVPEFAVEPGSGSTIMSYAGICGAENIVDHTDAMFHAVSTQSIDAFNSGASCGESVSILNPSLPVVDAGNDYTIPRKTPFILSASASDADGDALTYSWAQMDAGTATSAVSLGADFGDNALFRSYLPQAENSRHFPALGTTLQNLFDDSESLACQSRSLNFRVTARDGNSGIGRDDLLLSVDNDSGPFQLTSFNTRQSLAGLDSYDITWDVANTDVAPVNCATVDISLLTFNSTKSTYFETLLSQNETNDGSALVSLPDYSNSQARFKIQCSDNIFYDISDDDLVITGSSPFETTGKTVFYNTGGLLISDFPTESCSSGNSGFGDETNDTFFSADDIEFSDTYDYAIQFSNDIDYFKFSLPSAGTVTIQTVGVTDTMCGVYAEASSQSLISFDDDGGNRFNCLITEELDAGTYFISIEGAFEITTGDYSLEVDFSGETDDSSSSGGGGSIDFYWLSGLFSAFYFRRRLRDDSTQRTQR